MTKPTDKQTVEQLAQRVAEMEQRLAESEKHNRELLDRLNPPQPKPGPLYRTLPGTIGEYDCNGNLRGLNEALANVDPRSTTTSSGSSLGGVKDLGNGTYRFPDNLVRDFEGKIVIPNQPSAAQAMDGPKRTRAHEEAIRHAEKLWPLSHEVRRPDSDDAA